MSPQAEPSCSGWYCSGTGPNTKVGLDVNIARRVSSITGVVFTMALNKFEDLVALESFVETLSALNTLSRLLVKLANDMHYPGSGPRCGYGELLLLGNEPGSSIMPREVTPRIGYDNALIVAKNAHKKGLTLQSCLNLVLTGKEFDLWVKP